MSKKKTQQSRFISRARALKKRRIADTIDVNGKRNSLHRMRLSEARTNETSIERNQRLSRQKLYSIYRRKIYATKNNSKKSFRLADEEHRMLQKINPNISFVMQQNKYKGSDAISSKDELSHALRNQHNLLESDDENDCIKSEYAITVTAWPTQIQTSETSTTNKIIATSMPRMDNKSNKSKVLRNHPNSTINENIVDTEYNKVSNTCQDITNKTNYINSILPPSNAMAVISQSNNNKMRSKYDEAVATFAAEWKKHYDKFLYQMKKQDEQFFNEMSDEEKRQDELINNLKKESAIIQNKICLESEEMLSSLLERFIPAANEYQELSHTHACPITNCPNSNLISHY